MCRKYYAIQHGQYAVRREQTARTIMAWAFPRQQLLHAPSCMQKVLPTPYTIAVKLRHWACRRKDSRIQAGIALRTANSTPYLPYFIPVQPQQQANLRASMSQCQRAILKSLYSHILSFPSSYLLALPCLLVMLAACPFFYIIIPARAPTPAAPPEVLLWQFIPAAQQYECNRNNG
jgi:hypothetical protein